MPQILNDSRTTAAKQNDVDDISSYSTSTHFHILRYIQTLAILGKTDRATARPVTSKPSQVQNRPWMLYDLDLEPCMGYVRHAELN